MAPSQRFRPATGERVRLTIPPQLASTVARSALVVGHLERLVEQIAEKAQEAVPVGSSGNLRDSEEHGVLLTPSGAVGVIAYQAYYAHMVHNGTSHSPPNPWLLNAALGVMVGSTNSATQAA